MCAFLLILMINLYFFVDSPPATIPQQQRPRPKPQPKNITRAPKKPTFMATEQVELAQLQELIGELDDRILVVAFEDVSVEGSRKQMWKRWERISRALPKKKQFKRADEDELPMIVRFDCSGELGKACEQLVGPKLPAVVMWKSNIPRFFPEEIRTDTQVFNYLAKQMQEAVQYQETLEEAEYFVTEDAISLMYFGKDESGAYRHIADLLRDMANFGRTNDAEIAEAFEAEVPSLRLYRPFDESPLTFPGNLSDSQAIGQFLREYSVPMFGEWTPKTMKLYQNRKLPVVFIAVDPTEDETDTVLEVAGNLAIEFWGEMSFTQLDGIMNADVAARLGVTELPEVLILTGQEIRMSIDLDGPEASIRQAIAAWNEAATRGPEADATDLDEYDDEDYDDDYDGYDEEEEDFEEDSEPSDYVDEEEEKEEL